MEFLKVEFTSYAETWSTDNLLIQVYLIVFIMAWCSLYQEIPCVCVPHPNSQLA